MNIGTTKKEMLLNKMVPVGWTLVKKSVQPTGIFCILELRIWELGDIGSTTFSVGGKS